ncbi:MAG: GNAT family N-acetyltransferase [Acidovorax sp.]|nr:GNAT family N-acetyltransferase [Acidovorax sp.]
MRPEGRLTELRPFKAGDITPAYISWLNDPTVVRFSNQRFTAHTAESSAKYFNGFADSPNHFLIIRRRDTGEAIGTMTAYVSVPHGTADMGILVGDRRVWGGGFGLDAWRTLLEWLLAERGLRKVTAGTLDCNEAMLRLIHKSGMHHEATRRAQEIVEGAERNILYFARFRDGRVG